MIVVKPKAAIIQNLLNTTVPNTCRNDMIELIAFFCLSNPVLEWDCSYSVYLGTQEEVNDHWDRTGNVAALYNPMSKAIFLSDLKHFYHEWRHAYCWNHYNHYQENDALCQDPHFKIER